MSVPVIVSVSEDALRAVPDSYREAAIALGANKWEIVYRVLFPAAKSGLLAAVLLGVGRSIGETMAVLMATGHAVQIPHSVLDPVQTLPPPSPPSWAKPSAATTHYRVLFLIGIVLFAFAFIVNLTADLIVKGVRGDRMIEPTEQPWGSRPTSAARRRRRAPEHARRRCAGAAPFRRHLPRARKRPPPDRSPSTSSCDGVGAGRPGACSILSYLVDQGLAVLVVRIPHSRTRPTG